MNPLAAVDFQSPLTWAILIGWIMSVVLHEFAHGLVAYLGGDYTIKERGGLTLNPIQYIDPVISLLAAGGLPDDRRHPAAGRGDVHPPRPPAQPRVGQRRRRWPGRR